MSAAELSGDRHAAELIRQITAIAPKTRFFGLAGPSMQAAGCEVVEDFTARATMLVGAVRLAGHAYRLVRQVGRLAREHRPDLAVLVDSPALHLPMARQIRPSGTPILYYIAPQLWAWAPWRIGKVRRRVDRMAVLLPFEERYFRDRGVPADYVGHPLVTQVADELTRVRRDNMASLRAAGSPLIACLPGSREHVLKEVLPGQLAVARAIAVRYPKAAFVFGAADENGRRLISAALARGQAWAAIPHRVETGRNAEILSCADFALCASGTATLEVACHGVPMVIMYNGSKWGYRLVGRWLITTPHLSLVNILAGRRIVPEFMPYYTSTEPIIRESLDILGNPQRRARIKADLAAVVESLGTGRAAEQTARIALEMASSRGA
jgi:lipid-A-disaccharide synthase